MLVCVSGLILHEEHIELLSEDFKALKRELEGKILQEGTLHFTGAEDGRFLLELFICLSTLSLALRPVKIPI